MKWVAMMVMVATVLVGCGSSGAGNGADVDPIVSTFSAGDEGWSTEYDAQSFTWDAAGYVTASDLGYGVYWYFSAPSAFLGAKGEYYGGSITYEIEVPSSPSPTHPFAEVVLVGPINTISLDLGDVPTGAGFSTFTVQVDSSSDWRLNVDNADDVSGGVPASAAEIQAILSNLQGIHLCGEYNTSPDQSKLGYVALSPPGG